MKKFKSLFLILVFIPLLFVYVNIRGAEETSITKNGITIEGVSDGETFSKPVIKFYVSDRNYYYYYEVILSNNKRIEFRTVNKEVDVSKPIIKIEEENEESIYSIDDVLFRIPREETIVEVKLFYSDNTTIKSATLNNEVILTNTTLKYQFKNGEYQLIVTDTDGRVAIVNFYLKNNSYTFDVFIALLEGVKVTIFVFLITLLLSIPLGLLGAMLKKIEFYPFKFLSKKKYSKLIIKWNPLRMVLDLYTYVIRGTPLLLQLFVINFGIPILFGSQYNLGPMYASCIAFVINYTAYFIEIFRGGMETIKKGQFEAANVLGLSRSQMYVHVILPQTFKKVIPSITNEAITLVKDTALVASVSLADLLFITKQKVSLDFRLDAYVLAAIIYLLMTLVIVWIFKTIEKKNAFYN